MTFNICLINNYDNALYLKECIDSVLSQSVPFDQIIVVDDGSNDHSRSILYSYKNILRNFILLEKANEGQVSTFNFSRNFIPEESQVFLLDADDLYPLDYLENVLNAVQFKSWDFAFCEHHIFDNKQTLPVNSSQKSDDAPVFFRSTSALTRSRQCWIGNLTSTISLSGFAFREIFPYPIKRNETLYADDILIFASSILGYSKIYFPAISINWRSHEKNNSKKEYTKCQIDKRKHSINMLVDYYCRKYGIQRYSSFVEIFAELHHLDPGWIKKLGFPNRFKMLNRLLRQKIHHFFGG